MLLTLKQNAVYAALSLFALLFAVTPAFAATTYTAQLSGDEEVPPVTTNATGTLSITVNASNDEASYMLDIFNGQDITQAHLHCAEKGVEGPTIVTLYTANGTSTDVNGLLTQGTLEEGEILAAGEDCEEPVTDISSLISAINDGDIYVNVHNETYPDGLLRGQLIGSSTNDNNGTSTDDGDDDDNGTSTDNNGNDDDDDNGTSTDNNGNDDNGTSTENVTIHVMKHLCNANIDDLNDFEALEEDKTPLEALVATVLACPTIILPGDEASKGAITGGNIAFDFAVKGDNGTSTMQDIEDSTFMQDKLCENQVNVDVNDDGQVATSTCLDISHYEYDDVSGGDVTVTETDYPGNSRFGALRFTPTELAANNDEESLVSAANGIIKLDSEEDSNGAIMLHVYNFRNDGTGTSTDGNNNGTSTDNVGLSRLLDQLSSLINRLIDLYGQILNQS